MFKKKLNRILSLGPLTQLDWKVYFKSYSKIILAYGVWCYHNRNHHGHWSVGFFGVHKSKVYCQRRLLSFKVNISNHGDFNRIIHTSNDIEQEINQLFLRICNDIMFKRKFYKTIHKVMSLKGKLGFIKYVNFCDKTFTQGPKEVWRFLSYRVFVFNPWRRILRNYYGRVSRGKERIGCLGSKT